MSSTRTAGSTRWPELLDARVPGAEETAKLILKEEGLTRYTRRRIEFALAAAGSWEARGMVQEMVSDLSLPTLLRARAVAALGKHGRQEDIRLIQRAVQAATGEEAQTLVAAAQLDEKWLLEIAEANRGSADGRFAAAEALVTQGLATDSVLALVKSGVLGWFAEPRIARLLVDSAVPDSFDTALAMMDDLRISKPRKAAVAAALLRQRDERAIAAACDLARGEWLDHETRMALARGLGALPGRGLSELDAISRDTALTPTTAVRLITALVEAPSVDNEQSLWGRRRLREYFTDTKMAAEVRHLAALSLLTIGEELDGATLDDALGDEHAGLSASLIAVTLRSPDAHLRAIVRQALSRYGADGDEVTIRWELAHGGAGTLDGLSEVGLDSRLTTTQRFGAILELARIDPSAAWQAYLAAADLDDGSRPPLLLSLAASGTVETLNELLLLLPKKWASYEALHRLCSSDASTPELIKRSLQPATDVMQATPPEHLDRDVSIVDSDLLDKLGVEPDSEEGTAVRTAIRELLELRTGRGLAALFPQEVNEIWTLLDQEDFEGAQNRMLRLFREEMRDVTSREADLLRAEVLAPRWMEQWRADNSKAGRTAPGLRRVATAMDLVQRWTDLPAWDERARFVADHQVLSTVLGRDLLRLAARFDGGRTVEPFEYLSEVAARGGRGAAERAIAGGGRLGGDIEDEVSDLIAAGQGQAAFRAAAFMSAIRGEKDPRALFFAAVGRALLNNQGYGLRLMRESRKLIDRSPQRVVGRRGGGEPISRCNHRALAVGGPERRRVSRRMELRSQRRAVRW